MLFRSLAHCYAIAGKRDQARAVLGKMIDPQRYVNAYSTAAVYVALGEMDEAWRWLTTGFEERSWHMTTLGVDPKFDPLRPDPRLRELVRKIGVFNEETTQFRIDH